MDRRRFISALVGGSIFAAPLAAGAQQAGKVYRIGVLVPGSSAEAAPFVGVFRQGLRELGFVEGKNLVIELRYAETPVLLAQHADELTRLGVDVVVGTATPAALALKRATRTIPIVMGTASDPVQAGLVESLARPGGNITGSAVLFPEVTAKQMELIKEAHDKTSRILVIGNWSNPAIQRIWNTLPPPAQRLNVRLEAVDIRAPEDDLDAILTASLRQRPDALLVLVDPQIFFRFARIADFALSRKLTSISFYREFPESGGLMSYGPSLVELVRRSAWYVDKILKGAKPSDLPVEQPTKFDLVINLKTAKTLGLTIPKSVLVRADELIQ
jgi:putative tryptophan/tyrosine transport system substrate-binding protein